MHGDDSQKHFFNSSPAGFPCLAAGKQREECRVFGDIQQWAEENGFTSKRVDRVSNRT